ncbi:MAG: pentapeptide repeat-containing protein [Acidobacteria bacterium]|nr:pentapeptide repeat-containing protein [Acidobacteriota bacterium]
MYRRIALATAACALALPASALASEPAATGAGGVGVQPASGLKVTSVKASKSGRTVTAKVRWDRALIVRKAERERFTVRLLAGPAGARRLLGTVSRRAPRGTSETVSFRLNARNARRIKSSSRVFATATQQLDSPDTDRFYELNHVAIASMKGKRPFASAAATSCPTEIKPNTDMTGCQIPGANLAGADLSGVKFYKANLELSNLAAAKLVTTNLTQADLTGANLAAAMMNADEQAALTFPDEGDQIGKLIDSAKTSVDVVIYDFGGPNLVGQQGSPGALMRAVQRGVNVRVILNSSQGCKSMNPDDQRICAGGPALDPLYATEAALKWANANPNPGVTKPGKYRVQFSSQNYQITHQKSILIDTSDTNGNPLTADKMTTNSKIMVSTGNLQAYPVDWGQYLTCKQWSPADKYVCADWEVENAQYLTNPAGSCSNGKASGCRAEWAARDFAILVTKPDLMERIAAVYGADQSCKTWDQASVYQDLLTSDKADTWANGTLVAGGGGYPQMGTPAFYGGAPNTALEANPQGNSRQRQLDLIASAKQSLIVYNEEMADPDIVNALVGAAARGVSVRVVMASPFTNGVPTPKGEGSSPYTYYFSYLVRNGVKVRLLPSDQAGVDYIHAKAIVADGLNAFMGSENFGYSSMNYNRELGLMLTNITENTDPTVKTTAPSLVSVEGVASIMTAFQEDWSNPAGVNYVAIKPKYNPYDQFPTPPYPPMKPGKAFSGANMLCLPPGNDLYSPGLPDRQSPQTGPSN